MVYIVIWCIIIMIFVSEWTWYIDDTGPLSLIRHNPFSENVAD